MSLKDVPGLEELAPLRASSPPLRLHWALRVLSTLLLWSAFGAWLRLIGLALDTLAQHATPLLAQAWSWLS